MDEGGAKQSEEKRDEAGRFIVPPVSPGRPKGSRNKLGEAFIHAMYEDFQEHGADTIIAVREGKPDQYLKVVASILPKEIEAGERLAETLTDILSRIDGRTRTIAVERGETMQ